VRELFPALQANEIAEQIESLRNTLDEPEPQAPDRVPRTDDEQKALLAVRPPGWEYLLFASCLFLGKQQLEFKWRDHELPPYTPRHSLGSIGEATDHLSSEFNRVTGLIEAMMRVFPQEVQEQAFGEPGEPGDPVRIEHLAARITQTYSELMDWAASIRAVDPPDVLVPSFEMAARWADQPLVEIREFVDTVVREIDRIPAFVASRTEDDEPLEINLELKLTTDQEVSAEFHHRLKRAKRKIRWGF
jgi:hypothetical protein